MKYLKSILLLLPGVLGAQQQIIPIAPGAVTITLTFTQPNGTVGTAQINLVVTEPPIALIRPINALNPPRWVDSAVVRWPFCPVAWAIDAKGNTLTGRPVSWSTNDTSLARAALDVACPKLTIDPLKLQALPVPSGAQPIQVIPPTKHR